jgi:hypothetical protein
LVLEEKRRLSNKSQLKTMPQPLTLGLTNFVNGKSGTLLSIVEQAVRLSSEKGARRHLYVLTCYFDLPGLKKVTGTIRDQLNTVGGKLTGITVAVDVGEWIKRRFSVDMLAKTMATAAGVSPLVAKILPVRFPGHLLHAKAYAAIGSGDRDKSGFVVVTSGNATQPGLGLVGASNLELAIAATDSQSLAAFEGIIADLAKKQVSGQVAMQQDLFLRALALFTSGEFYHRWQGSLSAEIRFKLTLTPKGRKARKENAPEFSDYQTDSDTISRDPLNIERIFDKAPKPFPQAFWRTYSVGTLLGYWLPRPIAKLVDLKLSDDVEPYMAAIRQHTSTQMIAAIVKRLQADVIRFNKSKLIREGTSVVDTWRERVMDFRKDKELVTLRIYPYTRVPDLLSGETRSAVLEVVNILSNQLGRKKKLSPTKGVANQFLCGKLTQAQLDREWVGLAEKADETIN